MYHVIPAPEVIAELVDLGMTIMASGNAVGGPRGLNLLVFDLPKLQALLLETGLQEAAAAAAAIVIGAVGLHIDKVLFPDHRLDDISKVFGDGIAIAFSNDLTGILNRELDLQVFVPIGIDLQLSLANPLGVVFVDLLDFKIMVDVEFFQSGPD